MPLAEPLAAITIAPATLTAYEESSGRLSHRWRSFANPRRLSFARGRPGAVSVDVPSRSQRGFPTIGLWSSLRSRSAPSLPTGPIQIGGSAPEQFSDMIGVDFTVETVKKGDSTDSATGACVTLCLREDGVSLCQLASGKLIRRFRVQDIAGWKVTAGDEFALYFCSAKAGVVQTLTLRSTQAGEIGEACTRIISPAFDTLEEHRATDRAPTSAAEPTTAQVATWVVGARVASPTTVDYVDFAVEMLKRGAPPGAPGKRPVGQRPVGKPVTLRLRADGASLLLPDSGELLARLGVRNLSGWKVTADDEFVLYFCSAKNEAGMMQTLTLRSAQAGEIGDACTRIISPAFEKLAHTAQAASRRGTPTLSPTFSRLV